MGGKPSKSLVQKNLRSVGRIQEVKASRMSIHCVFPTDIVNNETEAAEPDEQQDSQQLSFKNLRLLYSQRSNLQRASE